MGNILTFSAALCAGISVACFLYLLLIIMGEIRIEKMSANDESRQKLPLFFRFLMILTPNVRWIADAAVFSDLREKYTDLLGMAGFEDNISGSKFLSIQILSTIVGALIGFPLMFKGSVLTGLLLILLLLIYPRIWLTALVSKRHLAIMKALPNMLDLLTLSVEAGKDFLSALRDILEKRKPDALGNEFLRALREIQLGKKRQDALREMALRVRQPELTSVIGSIVQADEMGVSIGQLLKIQSDQLRMKRFSLAEKLANEAPVKILFPVVVFIFPAVLLLLMAPILLQAYNMLG